MHLEIGQPGFPSPQHVVDAGKNAIDQGQTKYSPPDGVPTLREVGWWRRCIIKLTLLAQRSTPSIANFFIVVERIEGSDTTVCSQLASFATPLF